MKRMPAVHHNPNKLCSLRFWHCGTFVCLHRQKFKDRQAAMTHIKTYYRGASQISINFYVPQEGASI